MKITQIKTIELIPYDNNPRKNEDAVEKVSKSIKQFGFKVPIVVDSNYVVIAGHTRLKAALKLGIDEVPCIVADDLSESQIKAFRIADNRVAAEAEWDFDKLQLEIDAIIDEFSIEDLGFDEHELSFLDEEEEVKEDDYEMVIPEEPKSKRGELYRLGNHYLMCGDSTDQNDVDTLMRDKRADMVFTDPPWNVNYGAVEEGNSQGYKPRTILNDFMGTEQFKEFMYGAFKQMNDHSKEGAMTYVVMSAQEWGNMMLALNDNDYHWSSTIIWNKDHLVLSRKDYHTKYEPIWYGWKEGDSRLHPLKDRKQSDVWDYDRPTRSELHPTMKPVALVAKAIENSTYKDEIVLDLFGGSGTTLIACEQLKRNCYMMELDPKYVDVIIDRWEQLTGEEAEKVNEVIQ